MPNRDQDQRRSSQNQQTDVRSASQRNERSDISDKATDKSKRTQRSDQSRDWDSTEE